jgi:hypothetical protein
MRKKTSQKFPHKAQTEKDKHTENKKQARPDPTSLSSLPHQSCPEAFEWLYYADELKVERHHRHHLHN